MSMSDPIRDQRAAPAAMEQGLAGAPRAGAQTAATSALLHRKILRRAERRAPLQRQKPDPVQAGLLADEYPDGAHPDPENQCGPPPLPLILPLPPSHTPL